MPNQFLYFQTLANFKLENTSIKTDPSFNIPSFSPNSTILFPILSLTLPPALKNSHFTTISHSIPSSLPILFNRTSGVHPICSKMLLKIFSFLGAAIMEKIPSQQRKQSLIIYPLLYLKRRVLVLFHSMWTKLNCARHDFIPNPILRV